MSKYFSIALLALSLVALSLVGDLLYSAPAQLAAISTTNIQRSVPVAQRANVVNPRTSMLIVKLTREKAVELYPILLKKPTSAPNLRLFRKYQGTVNAPTWARPLYRFTVNAKPGMIPRKLGTDVFLQDLAGYLVVKFGKNADLATISKELSSDANVVYAAESTLAQLNPTIGVAITETSFVAGMSQEECEDACWRGYLSRVEFCEENLEDNPSDGELDEYYSCLSAAQINYMNCKAACKYVVTPPPPSSGGGFGGTSPGKLYQSDLPVGFECDPTSPLINCGP